MRWIQGPETLYFAYTDRVQILIAKRHRGVGAMSYIISASHVACSTCLIIQRTRKFNVLVVTLHLDAPSNGIFSSDVFSV